MEWDGFPPEGVKLKCDRCGVELSGRDGDRPAESYLGTYTGLCYTCQNAGPYVVETFFDGAKRLSYPPSCPSWRRDRELYTAYGDCPTCKGSGTQWWTSYPSGYRSYCEACFKRFINHPVRVADRAFEDEVNDQVTDDLKRAIKWAKV